MGNKYDKPSSRSSVSVLHVYEITVRSRTRITAQLNEATQQTILAIHVSLSSPTPSYSISQHAHLQMPVLSAMQIHYRCAAAPET